MKNMKKITFLLMALLLIAMPSSAQHYTQSRYYNKQTGHLDYGRHYNDFPDSYFGFRIGPSLSMSIRMIANWMVEIGRRVSMWVLWQVSHFQMPSHFIWKEACSIQRKAARKIWLMARR